MTANLRKRSVYAHCTMVAAGCLAIPFDLFFVAFDIDKKACLSEPIKWGDDNRMYTISKLTQINLMILFFVSDWY